MVLETAPVYGQVDVDGTTYEIVIGGSSPGQSTGKTGLTFKQDRHNTASKLDVTVLDDGDIQDGDELTLTIRDTPVFEGTVRSVDSGIGDRVRLTALGPIYDMKQATLTATYDEASLVTIGADALDEAGVDEYTVSLESMLLSLSYKDIRTDKVLEMVTMYADGKWVVTPDRGVVVTSDLTADVSSHDLEYIRDTSAGASTPAYQSVRVIGSSATPRKGRSSRHMVSSEPIVATAGSGEPTFEYEDTNLSDKEQAQNAADAIYKRLQEQQKSGWIEVVGREEIRPFDTVTMPDALGGETYLVSGIKHTIDKRDGFVTRINVGGVVDA